MATDSEKNSQKSQNGEDKKAQNEQAEPSELERKIIRQIEFYFGDANLPRDKFMLEQVKLDDGWIPMSTMLKFQRLAKLTSDSGVIVNALKHSQLMEVDSSESETKIRRAPSNPLPEFNAERRKMILDRTVYIKGFPLDSELDAIMTILEPYGPTENIHMRRYKDKVSLKFMFKGSVFVTFPTREKAEEFLNVPSFKLGETELLRLWQSDYIQKKKNEELEKKGRSKAEETSKEKIENDASKSLKKGATLHLSGEFAEKTTREDIKAEVAKLGLDHIVYIGFNKGDKEAFLRLATENSAAEYVEKWGSEITIEDAKIAVRALEGDEDEAYLKKAYDDRKAFMAKSSAKKRSGGFKKRRNQKQEGPPRKKRN